VTPPNRRTTLALALALSTIAACDTDTDTDFIQPTGGTLAVVLSGEAELSEVSWTLSGGALDDDEMMSGTIETSRTAVNTVSDAARDVSTHISGIPVGSGYTIELAGTLDDDLECLGSADFDIPFPAAVARATVILNCRAIDEPDNGGIIVSGGVNACPAVSVVVAPLRTRVGNTINLTATASDADGDPVTFTWSAARGAIAAPSSAATEYTCTEPGTVLIDLVAEDGNDCNVTRTVTVICTASDAAAKPA